MSKDRQSRATVTMPIAASPGKIYTAFADPEWPGKLWLSRASGHRRVGEPVEWHFQGQGCQRNRRSSDARRWQDHRLALVRQHG